MAFKEWQHGKWMDMIDGIAWRESNTFEWKVMLVQDDHQFHVLQRHKLIKKCSPPLRLLSLESQS